MTKELQELYSKRNLLVNKLIKTNYKAINYGEGVVSEEDYAHLKLQRQSWRDEINAIDERIKALKEDASNGEK